MQSDADGESVPSEPRGFEAASEVSLLIARLAKADFRASCLSESVIRANSYPSEIRLFEKYWRVFVTLPTDSASSRLNSLSSIARELCACSVSFQ